MIDWQDESVRETCPLDQLTPATNCSATAKMFRAWPRGRISDHHIRRAGVRPRRLPIAAVLTPATGRSHSPTSATTIGIVRAAATITSD